MSLAIPKPPADYVPAKGSRADQIDKNKQMYFDACMDGNTELANIFAENIRRMTAAAKASKFFNPSVEVQMVSYRGQVVVYASR